MLFQTLVETEACKLTGGEAKSSGQWTNFITSVPKHLNYSYFEIKAEYSHILAFQQIYV